MTVVCIGSVRREKGRKTKKTASLFEKKEKLTKIIFFYYP